MAIKSILRIDNTDRQNEQKIRTDKTERQYRLTIWTDIMDTGQTIPIDNTDRQYGKFGSSGASRDLSAKMDFELAEGFGPSLPHLTQK